MRATLTAILVGAVLAAGCAPDDGPSPDGTGSAQQEPTGSASQEPTGSAQEAPAGARVTEEPGDTEVDISMFSFGEDAVEISAGETVTWTNQDATLHTVTSGVDGEPDGAFHAELDGRDATASVTFDEPGEYHYFCTPHDFMTGTVVVTE